MLLSAAVDEFLKIRRLGNYKPHTISNYGRDLRQFREHVSNLIEHEPDAAEITRDHINAHLAALGHRGLKRISVERHRDCIWSFFVWPKRGPASQIRCGVWFSGAEPIRSSLGSFPPSRSPR